MEALQKQFGSGFCEVQDARNAAAGVLNPDVHHLLCAKLLAGGEDSSTLPLNLADAIQKYENLPDATKAACQSVLNPLIAFGLACGKENHFKEKLKLVIESLPHLDSESILQLHFGAPIAHEDRRSETRYVFAAPLVDLEAQCVRSPACRFGCVIQVHFVPGCSGLRS